MNVHARRLPRAALAAALLLSLLAIVGARPSAAATTYSQTQTLPVPPASSFSAAGAGDGWDVSLSKDRVYNVFHHAGTSPGLQVACHRQSDAGRCWGLNTPSKFVVDGQGRRFASPGHSGTYLEPSTGLLRIYAARVDGVAGVLCFDTTKPDTDPNPFCGFTELTAASQSMVSPWSNLSAPMRLGTKWYSFNYFAGSTAAANKLLCFDLATSAACAGQPYTVSFGPSGAGSSSVPAPTTAAIGGRIFVPNGARTSLACFDPATGSSCAGTWPASFSNGSGSPFPTLDATGAVTGLCAPNANTTCLTLAGATVSRPTGMSNVITTNSNWNGPAVVLGPRVYVPNGNVNRVQCWDYSTSQSCASFPKSLPSSLVYTVNTDPQRPTCLWTNADNGQRIQSFDAYSGGACGQGAIRVLASQFVVPQTKCTPSEYRSLEIVEPTRGSYTTGSVQFFNGAGNAIAGIPDQPLDGTGAADLTGLALNTATGLPQFNITLSGTTAAIGQVVVRLTWTADYDAACVAPGAQVPKEPTALAVELTGDGASGSSISVRIGNGVTAAATLTGTNAGGATGTVTYTAYSDAACTVPVSSSPDEAIITPGQLAAWPVDLPAGTYNVVVAYSGDSGNEAAASACGANVLKVRPLDDVPPTIVAAATTEPTAEGWYAGDVVVAFTCADNDGGSGLADGTCPAPETLTGEGAVSSTPFTITDLAGNESLPSNVITAQIDRTKPVIVFDGRTSYSVVDDVALICSATDALSGLASSVCPSVTGAAWSYGPGTHSLSATAVDKAGNTTSTSASFTITASPSSLSALINEFTADNGTRTSLAAHLTNFERSRARGQSQAAAAQLASFRAGVEERRGRTLTSTQADVLLAFASAL